MKTKFPRAVAAAVAQEILTELAPYCQRIEIAGSLRRCKPEVGDIELLFIPSLESRPDGLFDRKDENLALEAIDKMLAVGMLAKRPNVNGHFSWGEKTRLAIHVRTGLGVDFFSTTEKHWWTSLVIRTGPAPWNINLIMWAEKRGRRIQAYGNGTGVTDRQGNDLPVTSEQDVLRLAGVPWQEPEDRRV